MIVTGPNLRSASPATVYIGSGGSIRRALTEAATCPEGATRCPSSESVAPKRAAHHVADRSSAACSPLVRTESLGYLCADADSLAVHIDHVGVATDDATGLAEQYVELLDCSIAHEETFDGMAVLFLGFENGYLELLEPLDDEGTIARYLDRNGPGLHHVGLETEDAAAALDRARALGVEPIDEEPRPGAWGHDVAFLHPRDTGGILLEFVEH